MMSYKDYPQLPLEGSIDLTYRCNNRCRHCWISIPEGSLLRENELSFEKIRQIVDEARALGCRQWAISGGEPLLHPEFEKIFGYITKKSITYSINTNGTLITPEIAEMFRKKGNKMVALYGATEEIHDHITRIKGSYQATMQGFKNLIRAGAGFTVQIVPMRDNFHQYNEMIELAKSLSPHYRIGAAWLFKSASGSALRNREIEKQRLNPKDVIFLDNPDPTDQSSFSSDREQSCTNSSDDFLFAGCIEARRDFHIDPYGGMSFCSFIQDPDLRINLKKVSFQEVWEKVIPSMAESVRGGDEYRATCGSCEYRADCNWCPVYSYLERRRYSAPVEYLCKVARESRRFKEDWWNNHRRFFNIAGITIQVETDLPITNTTFHKKFRIFQTEIPNNDRIFISHHFSLPSMEGRNLGELVYKRPPWAIYHLGQSWIYLGIFPDEADLALHLVAVFNSNHTRGRIYCPNEEAFQKGDLHSLTMLTSDQIVLARVLADHEACYLHAAGMIQYGKGVLYIGHSEAGKSTTVTMLRDEGEILCDDRIIVRRWPEGFRIHGTWSHGDVPDVSNSSAPLKAIFFLEKADTNKILPIEDRKEIVKMLPLYVVKPLVTADWWEKMLDLIEKIAREVPVYRLKLDKSGRVKIVLKEFLCRELP